MKRILFFMAAVLALVGCTRQQSNPLAEYRQQVAQLDSLFQLPDLTEEQADQALEGLMAFSDSLFQAAPSDSLAVAILSDLVWYLPLEQRERLFGALDPDALDEAQLHYYKAFLAEKQTAVGCRFSDFGALTPAGDSLYLSSLVGQSDYLLIDFWATWCSPCRASMPALKALYQEAAGRLEILGVSLDADHDKWAEFIPANGLSWKHMSDLRGWDCAPAALYGVSAIPATVLLDREGNIVARNASPEELRAILGL